MILKKIVRQACRKAGFELRRLRSHHVDPFEDQAMLLANQSVESIFDVGASEGYTAQHYRKLFPKAHIFSFEPGNAYEKLCALMKSDRMVTPINAAVGEKRGSALLHLNSFDQTNSLLANDQNISQIIPADQASPVGTQSVAVVSIDQFCQDHQLRRINILKMDIQGFELNALRGAQELLEKHAIDLILCEVLFARLYDGQAFYDQIASFLRPFDYQLYGLYDLMRSRNGTLGWADAIFLSPQLQAQLKITG